MHGGREEVAGATHEARRISPGAYKALLTAHIIVSVGWLGIVSAKLMLGIVAATSDDSGLSGALYVAAEVVNVAFPRPQSPRWSLAFCCRSGRSGAVRPRTPQTTGAVARDEVGLSDRVHHRPPELSGGQKQLVRNYLPSAIRKLGARNRVEAAKTAEREGWL